MSAITKIFAGIAGIVHVLFFLMESVLWMNPSVHSRFLVQSIADAEVINVFIMNQGFYNLFLAIGMFVGLAIWGRNETVGKTLVGYISAVMVGAAAVLIITVPAMFTGFLIQGVAPLIAIVSLLMNRS